ncbi:BON domain-containing protein [Sinosporangium album]|uniref:BON domain-containing protein n=1 Tax=Sinosporangium album TaxID=504805 RepID=A0A1G8EWP1_9ACTN|nr:CBS domain-containing protein [Sinosporangium album]SDH74274.1 BON domain-containing protein [Sinosporangium album]
MSVEVRDVMGRVAIAVTPEAPFIEIVEAMRRYAVGAVAVIDAERRPMGIVSEDDLILKEADLARHSTSMYETRNQGEMHRKATGVIARELMTTPAITVTPGRPLREAARLMHDKRVKQLPVVDPATGRIVGTLHCADVLRVFLRPAEELLTEIRDLPLDPETFTVEVNKGVVTIAGRVKRASEALQIVEQIYRVEGVVDVVSQITADMDDRLQIIPPLREDGAPRL